MRFGWVVMGALLPCLRPVTADAGKKTYSAEEAPPPSEEAQPPKPKSPPPTIDPKDPKSVQELGQWMKENPGAISGKEGIELSGKGGEKMRAQMLVGQGPGAPLVPPDSGFKGVVLSLGDDPEQLKALRGQLGPGQSMLVVSPVGPAPDAVRSLKMAEAVAAAKGNGAGLLIVSPPGGAGPAAEIRRFLKGGTPEAQAAARKVAAGKIVFYDGAPKLGRHVRSLSFSGTPSDMRDALAQEGRVGRGPYQWGRLPPGKDVSQAPPERRPAIEAVGEGQSPLARRLAPYVNVKDPKVLRALMREGVTLPSEALRGVPPGYRVRVRAFGNCPDPSSCKAAVVIASGHGDGPVDYVGGWLKKNFEKMAGGLRPGQLALVVSPIANSGKWPGSRGPGVGKAYADIMEAVAAAAGNPKAPFAIQAGSGGGQGLLFPIIQYLARDPAGKEFAQRLAKIVNSEALFAYPRSDWYHDLATLLKDNPGIKMDTVWSAYAGRYENFLAMLKNEEVPHPRGRFTFQRAGSHPQTFPMGVDSLMRGVDLDMATAKLSEPHVKKYEWGALSRLEQSIGPGAPVPVVGPGVAAKGLQLPPAEPAAGPKPREFTLEDARKQIANVDRDIYSAAGGRPFADRLKEKWDALQKAYGAAHVMNTFVRMPGEEVEYFARYLKDGRGDFNAALASFFDGEFPGWRKDPAAREIMARTLGAPPELLKKHHALWDPDGRYPDPGQASSPVAKTASVKAVVANRIAEWLKDPVKRAQLLARADPRTGNPFLAEGLKVSPEALGYPADSGVKHFVIRFLGEPNAAPKTGLVVIHGDHVVDHAKRTDVAMNSTLSAWDKELKGKGESMLLVSPMAEGKDGADMRWRGLNAGSAEGLFKVMNRLSTMFGNPDAKWSVSALSGGGKFLNRVILKMDEVGNPGNIVHLGESEAMPAWDPKYKNSLVPRALADVLRQNPELSFRSYHGTKSEYDRMRTGFTTFLARDLVGSPLATRDASVVSPDGRIRFLPAGSHMDTLVQSIRDQFEEYKRGPQAAGRALFDGATNRTKFPWGKQDAEVRQAPGAAPAVPPLPPQAVQPRSGTVPPVDPSKVPGYYADLPDPLLKLRYGKGLPFIDPHNIAGYLREAQGGAARSLVDKGLTLDDLLAAGKSEGSSWPGADKGVSKTGVALAYLAKAAKDGRRLTSEEYRAAYALISDPVLQKYGAHLENDPAVGFAVMDLTTGKLLASNRNAAEPWYGASTPKAIVAGAFLNRRMTDIQQVTRKAKDGTPLTKRELQLYQMAEAGQPLTREELHAVSKLLVDSDNGVWSAIQDWAGGKDAVQAFSDKVTGPFLEEYARAHGLDPKDLRMHPARNGGNSVSALGLVRYMQAVANHEFAGADLLDKFMHACNTGFDSRRGPEFLPADLSIAGKTGTYGQSNHDMRFFQGPDGHAYAVAVNTLLNNKGDSAYSAFLQRMGVRSQAPNLRLTSGDKEVLAGLGVAPEDLKDLPKTPHPVGVLMGDLYRRYVLKNAQEAWDKLGKRLESPPAPKMLQWGRLPPSEDPVTKGVTVSPLVFPSALQRREEPAAPSPKKKDDPVPPQAPARPSGPSLPSLRRLDELKARYPAWRAQNEAAAKARGYLPFDPTRTQAYQDGDIIDLTGIPGLEGLEALKVKCLGRCGSAAASEIAFIAHGMHGGDYSGDGNPVGPSWLNKGRLAATLADLHTLDARLKDSGKSMLLGYLFSQKDKGQERAAEPTRHWPTFMNDRVAQNGDITAALFYHLLGTSGVDPGATVSIAGFSGGGKFLKATVGFMMTPEGADLRRRLRTVAGMDETYWGTQHYVDLARLSAQEGTPVTFHFIGQDRFSDQDKLRRELLGLYQSEKGFPGQASAAQREEARRLLRGRQASVGEPSEFRFGQDSFRFERVRSHIDAIVGQMTDYFAERPGERGMGMAEPAAPPRPRFQWGRVFDGAGAPRQDIVTKGITVSPPPVPVAPAVSAPVPPPVPPLDPELKSRIDAINAGLARRPSPQARLVEEAKKRLSGEQLDLLRKNAFLEARRREAAAGLPVNGLPLFAAIIQFPAPGRDQKLGELTFFDPKGNVLLAVPVDGSRPSVNGAPTEGTGLFYTNLVTQGQRGADGPLGDGRGRHEAGDGWINLAPAEYLDQLARHYRVPGAERLDPDDARAARALAGLPAEKLPEGDRNFKFCIRPDSGLASRGCWRTPDVLGTQVSQLITEGIDRSVLSARPDGQGGVVVRKSLPIAMSLAPRADAAAAWERMRGQLRSLPLGAFFDGSAPRPAAARPTPSPVGDEVPPSALIRGRRIKSRGVPSEPPDMERAAEEARKAREKLLTRHVPAPAEPATAKGKGLDPRWLDGAFDGAAGRLMKAIVSPEHAPIPATIPPFMGSPTTRRARGEDSARLDEQVEETGLRKVDSRLAKDILGAAKKHPVEVGLLFDAARRYADQYLLPPDDKAKLFAQALALAYSESGLDPGAVSRTGVPGIMQVTGGTNRGLGFNNRDPRMAPLKESAAKDLESRFSPGALEALRRGAIVSNRDPVQNSFAGVELLVQLLKRLRGDYYRAVDAYNGEGKPGYVRSVVATEKVVERLTPALLSYATLPEASKGLAASMVPLVDRRLSAAVPWLLPPPPAGVVRDLAAPEAPVAPAPSS